MQGTDGKGPVMVGHLYPVAGDRVGDGNGCLLDAHILRAQIGSNGILLTWLISRRQGVDGVQASAVA